MPGDPRDYKVELTGANDPGATGEPSPAEPAGPRPFLSVHFACCGAYQRIYRNPDGKHYQGRCPRCARPVRFTVGESGTAARCFVAT